MLNTLSNHGYLPRDGKNIDVNTTIEALGTALNIDAALATFLYEEAITTDPLHPDVATFSLADLARHDILEHDASLSRVDYYFGNPQPFNQAAFDQTRSYWTGDIINLTMVANARYARVETSNNTNPTFSMSQLGLAFSYGESAAYVGILGDKVSGTVPKKFVEYLFENERLPFSLGWSKNNASFSQDDLRDLSTRIENLTPSPVNETTVATATGRAPGVN
jgi:hypothetical protein